MTSPSPLPAPAARRALGEKSAAFLLLLLYTAATLLYLRPIWRRFATHVAPFPEDPLYNLYVLEWGGRQLRLGLPDFWNANFYFPTPAALTLSDHLFRPALQLALLRPLLPWEELFGGRFLEPVFRDGSDGVYRLVEP